MVEELHHFYFKKEEPVKSCLIALRSIILGQDKTITESLKWGMPCFSYRKKMFCFLWTDKRTGEPYILLVEGRHLDHPKLEEGSRSRMKILRIDPGRDLPIKTIERILRRALELYRAGILKTKE